MKKRFFTISILTVLSFLVLIIPVYGQDADYAIRLRRDFGYGAGSNVRGTFTISLLGDDSQVVSVDFLIDGEVMASVVETPFRHQFHTDDYGFGAHQLSALVFLEDGSMVRTASVGLNFVSPEDERQSLVKIFTGIGVALIIPLVIFVLIQARIGKRKPTRVLQPGETQNYRVLGGAICPKCGRPFPRHLWGLNLVVGKFDRCEHCGKWSLTVRATPEELKAAEESELSLSQPDRGLSSRKGEVQDALEDTKYFDQL